MQKVTIGDKVLWVSETEPEAVKVKREQFEEYPDLLTPEHIAEITGQCQATIRNLCSTGALPATRIGRRWYVPKLDFLDYIKAGSGHGA